MTFFTKIRRLTFSQRIGKKPVKTEFQIEKMDMDLRNSLWNAFKLYFADPTRYGFLRSSGYEDFYQLLWHDYFSRTLDTLPDWFPDTYGLIRKDFFAWKWYSVYDFLEYISQIESPVDIDTFRNFCNAELERHLSAYRFVAGEIARIVEPCEIIEIEEAFSNAYRFKFKGVYIHLKSALEKFSNKTNPDYRNSIKDSISAVESICRIITNDKEATLGEALGIIERGAKVKLSKPIKIAFDKLYGYASSSDGIRHAMLDESNCQSEDAKYMLVSCSAFVNYLIEKSNKAGIKF